MIPYAVKTTEIQKNIEFTWSIDELKFNGTINPKKYVDFIERIKLLAKQKTKTVNKANNFGMLHLLAVNYGNGTVRIQIGLNSKGIIDIYHLLVTFNPNKVYEGGLNIQFNDIIKELNSYCINPLKIVSRDLTCDFQARYECVNFGLARFNSNKYSVIKSDLKNVISESKTVKFPGGNKNTIIYTKIPAKEDAITIMASGRVCEDNEGIRYEQHQNISRQFKRDGKKVIDDIDFHNPKELAKYSLRDIGNNDFKDGVAAFINFPNSDKSNNRNHIKDTFYQENKEVIDYIAYDNCLDPIGALQTKSNYFNDDTFRTKALSYCDLLQIKPSEDTLIELYSPYCEYFKELEEGFVYEEVNIKNIPEIILRENEKEFDRLYDLEIHSDDSLKDPKYGCNDIEDPDLIEHDFYDCFEKIYLEIFNLSEQQHIEYDLYNDWAFEIDELDFISSLYDAKYGYSDAESDNVTNYIENDSYEDYLQAQVDILLTYGCLLIDSNIICLDQIMFGLSHPYLSDSGYELYRKLQEIILNIDINTILKCNKQPEKNKKTTDSQLLSDNRYIMAVNDCANAQYNLQRPP